MLWHRGQISEDDGMTLLTSDRGLTLGDGLFETLPAFEGKAFLADAHLDRLMASAARFRLPLDRAVLARAVAELAGADKSPCVIRLSVSRGAGQRGLALPEPQTPNLWATRSPWTQTMAFGTARLATSSIRRHATSPSSAHKTLSYLDSIMAFDEAKQKAADDALMLDGSGHVASTAMANLFAVSGSTVMTPPATGALLPGIMRALILDHAGALGVEAIEKPLHPRDLYGADLVFATNSVRLVTHVMALDGVPLNSSADGVMTALQTLIKRLIQDETGFRLDVPS